MKSAVTGSMLISKLWVVDLQRPFVPADKTSFSKDQKQAQAFLNA
jgi:hypothetical protein